METEEGALKESALHDKFVLGHDLTDDMMSEMFLEWDLQVGLIMAQTELDRLTVIRAYYSCGCDFVDALTKLGE